MKVLTGKGHRRGLHVEPRLPSNTRNIYVPKTGRGAGGKANIKNGQKAVGFFSERTANSTTFRF